jgi:hypothetical protein
MYGAHISHSGEQAIPLARKDATDKAAPGIAGKVEAVVYRLLLYLAWPVPMCLPNELGPVFAKRSLAEVW